jgi:hypothetical protein
LETVAGEDEQKTEWWRHKHWWVPGVILVLLVIVDLVAAFGVHFR